jgi:hypothetical protein
VRKYFPTKEVLFQNCTRAFGETLNLPDLTELGAIAGAEERIEAGVTELCRVHEAMFGYAWLSAQQRGYSPTLDAEMAAYESLADAVADLITPPGSPRAALVRGLLDYLTYRALRLSARLSEQAAAAELAATVRTLIISGGR